MKMCKRNFGRRLVSLVLIVALLAALTSCGGSKTEKSAKYRVTDFLVSQSSDESTSRYIHDLRYYNDKIYYLQNDYDEKGEKLKSVDIDGGNETVVFEIDSAEENVSLQNYAVDGSGNIWILFNSYSVAAENEESDESFSEINSYIKEYDSNKNEIANIDLSKVLAGSESGYINLFNVTSNGTICISDSSKMYILDSAGALKNTFDFSYISNMALLGDSKILVSGYDTDSFVLKQYDFEKNNVDKECKFDNSPNFIITNNVDTIYMGNNTGMYTYDINKQKSTLLFEWSDMNINSSTLSETVALSEDRFIIGEYGEGVLNDTSLKLLERDDSLPDDERTVITLGCMYLDYFLQKSIVDFNKTNTKYKVEYKEYVSENTDDDKDIYTKLNTEIISGKSLDLVDMSSIPDRSNYEQKNLLADLNTYFDSDGDISKSDFVESILEAYETNGKLYSIPISFMLSTLAGSADKLGTTQAMTFAQINECAANNNIERIYTCVQSDILRLSLCTSQSSFINLEQKTCNFDSPEFKSVLEYASKFPSEYDNDFSVSEYKKFMDGNVLFLDANMSLPQEYTIYRYLAKDQLTFTGYPTLDGNGNIAQANSEIGILDKSANKDGAWEFVKFVLSEGEQDSFEWSFPIRKSSLDKMLVKATKSQDLEDESLSESGEATVSSAYGGIITEDGIDIELGNITEEEVEIIKNLINSTKHNSHYDDKVLEIIEDEAAAYFAGTKSVDDVAGAIQSRAQVYVNEQK